MNKYTRPAIYNTNPFIGEVVLKTKERRVFAGRRSVPDLNGNKTAVLYEQKVVDSDQFVKLYANALIAMTEIGKAALQLFNRMIDDMEFNKGHIRFNVALYAEEMGKSPSHAYRLIRELIDKNFIARSINADEYFININLVCKGDRLFIINEYVKSLDSGEIEPNKEFDQVGEGDLPQQNPTPGW